MKILILGGYGVFGGRLAVLLSDLANIELIIAGRSAEKAKRFCATYRGQARARPLVLDRIDIADALRSEKPDLVVDASGPFQDYGDEPYRVVKACIGAGIDYLDFADAADFVFGISTFDADAHAAGVFVLSGVSSFPVLTAAVLRDMEKRMDILSVEGGIAPSPFAGIGMNVMRAVLGYAGEPVKLRRDGRPAAAPGLAESRRFTVAVPGRLPLRNIRFSLVDVPDLQVIPPEHPGLQNIWMGAGPVPEVLHRALNLLARLRARRFLPNLAPLSRVCFAVLNTLRFGEHRGGMYVRATGLKDGAKVEESWHLLAEGDDGPFIPSMAIEGLVRKLLAGKRPEAGARSGVKALELSDYSTLFDGRDIHTGFRTETVHGSPLYRRILGNALDTLPIQVRALHDSTAARRWQGQAEVRRGKGLMAAVLCRLFGFPHASDIVPVSVELAPKKDGEVWRRTFGDKAFASDQYPGRGRNAALLIERFGPFRFALALITDGDRMFFVPRRWSFLGVPMPAALLPKGSSFETEQDGKFRFDVEIAMPLIGRIVAYRGNLEPVMKE